MGWDFTQGQTKAGMVQYLCKPWEREGIKRQTIASRVVGNQLWTVVTKTDANGVEKDRYIALYLLSSKRNYGYGYKSLAECEHPYYYDCPLAFLDMAPPSNEEWRRIVREHHARKNQTLSVGQTIDLTNKKSYRIVSIKPLKAVEVGTGITYRIPRSMLTLPKPAEPKSIEFVKAVNEVA